MRIMLCSMSAAMLLVIAAMPVEAACPANPNRASLDIWPRDTLTSGRVVSARHPCGRTLQCIAGVNGQRGTRQCQWL